MEQRASEVQAADVLETPNDYSHDIDSESEGPEEYPDESFEEWPEAVPTRVSAYKPSTASMRSLRHVAIPSCAAVRALCASTRWAEEPVTP